MEHLKLLLELEHSILWRNLPSNILQVQVSKLLGLRRSNT